MKKITMIFGVVAMVLFAACTKQEAESATKTLTLNATMAQVAPDTKTVFGEDGKSIEWVGGEQILVMDKNGVKATLTATVPGKTTTITGEVPAGFVETEPYYAFYPAEMFGEKGSSYGVGNTIELTLPATQTNFNGIANGANPSYARVAGEGMVSFKNICTIIKISVKAKDTRNLSSIRLQAAATQITGKVKFAYEEEAFVNTDNTKKEISVTTNWTPTEVGETISAYFVAPEFTTFTLNVYPGLSSNAVSRTGALYEYSAGTIYNMPTLYWKDNIFTTTEP